jgi:hypothetical protein
MGRSVMGKSEDGTKEFREGVASREREMRWMGEIVKKVQDFVNVHDVCSNGCVKLVSCFTNGWIVAFIMQMIEIARRMRKLMWRGRVPEAEGTVRHGCSGSLRGIGKGGVT